MAYPVFGPRGFFSSLNTIHPLSGRSCLRFGSSSFGCSFSLFPYINKMKMIVRKGDPEVVQHTRGEEESKKS